MKLLEQLENPNFKLSKSDKKFMDYIKKNIANISHTAIAKLADESGIGEATITRFVKKMGFSSLQEFKLTLAGELKEKCNQYIINNHINRNESALTTGRKLIDISIGTLEKTLNSMPDTLIEKCSAVIRQAKHLYFIGLGNSGFTALDSAYKFYRIGFQSSGFDNSHTMIITASLAQKGDVLVAISHAGYSPEIIQTIRLAKKNTVTVILITSNKEKQTKYLADFIITYEAKESLLETGSIVVKMAQFFVMDLLYTQVVKEMDEKAVTNKQKTTKAIQLLHN
ncbi:MurR/RpiR family transcriptional regulator [Pectinatus frisingensis]|uniref:MurR/RpiR family transcriptional regulator n=1 Tax=Pectinatus frisingensis TaxID=865 RepID=UPI0018C48FBB|nr:MurR/RpiR family transcriptional regulator [Pectinatus frisingensis]